MLIFLHHMGVVAVGYSLLFFHVTRVSHPSDSFALLSFLLLSALWF